VDPEERDDLASEYPDVVADLTRRIEAWTALHPEEGVRYSRRAPADFAPPDDWAD